MRYGGRLLELRHVAGPLRSSTSVRIRSRGKKRGGRNYETAKSLQLGKRRNACGSGDFENGAEHRFRGSHRSKLPHFLVAVGSKWCGFSTADGSRNSAETVTYFRASPYHAEGGKLPTYPINPATRSGT